MMFFKIDWTSFLLGDENWEFLLETTLRSLLMFLVILFSLRLLGKRGIKQLSVFELGVIIGLGSAAGDPMFYKDVGILAGLVVFAMVLGLYKLVTFLINRSDRFERFVEGKPTYLIMEGAFVKENLEKEPIAREEILMQLRLNNVSHLGQVQCALLETNGELSIWYYTDEARRPGLPIYPHRLEEAKREHRADGPHACCYCGHTQSLSSSSQTNCPTRQKDEWVVASEEKRIH